MKMKGDNSMLRVWVLVSLSCLSAMCLAQTVFEEIMGTLIFAAITIVYTLIVIITSTLPLPRGKSPSISVIMVGMALVI